MNIYICLCVSLYFVYATIFMVYIHILIFFVHIYVSFYTDTYVCRYMFIYVWFCIGLLCMCVCM